MRTRRKIGIAVVVTLLLACLALPFQAGAVSPQGGVIGEGTNKQIQTYWIQNTVGGEVNIGTFPAGKYIVGFKLIATGNNAQVALFDSATLPTTKASTTTIDELAEINSGGTALQMWPHPYKIVTALSVGLVNADAAIYYY